MFFLIQTHTTSKDFFSLLFVEEFFPPVILSMSGAQTTFTESCLSLVYLSTVFNHNLLLN